MFSTPHSWDVALGHDPQLGYLLLGPYVPAGEPSRLRAVDFRSGRLMWEALHGIVWAEPPTNREIAVRGRNVYLAHEGALVVLDLPTGAVKWRAPLPGRVDLDADHAIHGDEIQLFDIMTNTSKSVVAVVTESQLVSGFDRESGALLWHRAYESTIRIQPVAPVGLVVHVQGSPRYSAEVFDATRGKPIVAFGRPAGSQRSSVDRVYVDGQKVYLVLSSGGFEETEGVLAVDAASGQRLFFEVLKSVDNGIDAALGDGRLFFGIACHDGSEVQMIEPEVRAPRAPSFIARLLSAKPPERQLRLPVRNHRVLSFRLAGQVFFAHLEAYGTHMRRVVAFDAPSCTLRFDSGDLGSRPSFTEHLQMQTNGEIVVYTASPTNDGRQCTLVAYDVARGAVIWEVPVGEWDAHYFLGDALVLRANEALHLLRLDTGGRTASYPFPRDA